MSAREASDGMPLSLWWLPLSRALWFWRVVWRRAVRMSGSLVAMCRTGLVVLLG